MKARLLTGPDGRGPRAPPSSQPSQAERAGTRTARPSSSSIVIAAATASGDRPVRRTTRVARPEPRRRRAPSTPRAEAPARGGGSAGTSASPPRPRPRAPGRRTAPERAEHVVESLAQLRAVAQEPMAAGVGAPIDGAGHRKHVAPDLEREASGHERAAREPRLDDHGGARERWRRCGCAAGSGRDGAASPVGVRRPTRRAAARRPRAPCVPGGTRRRPRAEHRHRGPAAGQRPRVRGASTPRANPLTTTTPARASPSANPCATRCPYGLALRAPTTATAGCSAEGSVPRTQSAGGGSPPSRSPAG